MNTPFIPFGQALKKGPIGAKTQPKNAILSII
jgi:hypothetical protein